MPDVKTPPLIVLDTNVLVSGLLKRNSPPGQVLDLILSGAIWLALDARIIDEYSRVLKRPSLKIPSVAARNVLGFLIVTGERVPSEP